MPRWERRLDDCARDRGLEPSQVAVLRRLLELVRDDPHAPTPIRDPGDAVDRHVADSLAGLEVEALRAAGSLADLGSGAGFPGLVLAVALPRARVTLVESVGRKAAWLGRARDALDLANVDVAAARAEEWRGEPVDVVTARALAPLPVLVEYAAPLLRLGGSLLAWKGAPDPTEEDDGRAAAKVLGLVESAVVPVAPFPGVRDRRLYVYEKAGATPAGYPRRPGAAAKRPLRADRPRR